MHPDDEDEIAQLLRQLDHPPPRVDAEVIAAMARRQGVRWTRWAAGIALAVGVAGAAYAIPDSPLRHWVAAVSGWLEGARTPNATPPPAPRTGPTQGFERALGVAVQPGQRLVIAFTSSQAAGHARVSLTGGDAVVVRALTGAPSFTSDVDRLVVDNRGSSATFSIEIPRTAPRVEIELDGRRIFLKEADRVTAEQSADSEGAYVLPL